MILPRWAFRSEQPDDLATQDRNYYRNLPCVKGGSRQVVRYAEIHQDGSQTLRVQRVVVAGVDGELDRRDRNDMVRFCDRAHLLLELAEVEPVSIKLLRDIDSYGVACYVHNLREIRMELSFLQLSEHRFKGAVDFIIGHEIGHYIIYLGCFLDAKHQEVAEGIRSLPSMASNLSHQDELICDYVGGRLYGRLNRTNDGAARFIASELCGESDSHPNGAFRATYEQIGFQHERGRQG